MLETVLLTLSLAVPQSLPSSQPTSRPASRPTSELTIRKPLPDDRQRMKPAEWGRDAPGRAVMRNKVMPIKSAPYATPDKLKAHVSDKDLVIGLVAGGKALAYPIKMLGGPSREIINEEFGGVPFCVNW